MTIRGKRPSAGTFDGANAPATPESLNLRSSHAHLTTSRHDTALDHT